MQSDFQYAKSSTNPNSLGRPKYKEDSWRQAVLLSRRKLKQRDFHHDFGERKNPKLAQLLYIDNYKIVLELRKSLFGALPRSLVAGRPGKPVSYPH
jgi:hypothetical protein